MRYSRDARKRTQKHKRRFAKLLRKQLTPAAQAVWQEMRRRKWSRFVHRERALGHWIADFYCPGALVAVEIDGGYHQSPYRRALDVEKEGDLWIAGIQVVRFTNQEVFRDCVGTVDHIFAAIAPRWKPSRKREHEALRVLMYQRVRQAKAEHYYDERRTV